MEKICIACGRFHDSDVSSGTQYDYCSKKCEAIGAIWQMNCFAKYVADIWLLDAIAIHWKKNYVDYVIKNLMILIHYNNMCKVVTYDKWIKLYFEL